jgi:hypothetical protein
MRKPGTDKCRAKDVAFWKHGSRGLSDSGLKAALVLVSRHVAEVPILLQKDFAGRSAQY